MDETDRSENLGGLLLDRVRRLRPHLRSLTGDGVRATLDVIADELPIERHSVPSGSRACDWVVPDEWNVAAAHVTHVDGRRVVDLADHDLHLVGYSVPVRERMDLAALRPHLHTLPEHPDWIPYRTTYYHRDWGFCLTQRVLDSLDEGPYDVVVDSRLETGELVWGELVVPGESEDEVLVSSHLCHPSMANDNLSGLAVAVELARQVRALPSRRLTYRFVFAPGTIGSLVWLEHRADVLPRVRHGLVLTGVGGPGPLVYKRSRHGDRSIDRAAAHVVARRRGEIRDYTPWGYDERQYNSLGFDLPVGRLTRTPHGEYPEYHTSADDLDLLSGDHLEEAVQALLEIVEVIEHDGLHRNLLPRGEPQLGRRGLYPTTGGQTADDAVMAMLWVLALADGRTSLLEIAERADTDFGVVRAAARRLLDAGVLEALTSDAAEG
ncbi:DUF4910 domain-containing protein [Janibacter indicus]|uniref:Aminopeptidase-like domain-containing protein n=1 Tax=Janibacter indicus TaxID=857417 RepID=A0A1W1ZQ00_9MICO|nr:DUF4910 domain-containing protein [Janibacter indicus]SMC50630.1 aminopeptidase-like domain-containing protein [Janibacter indicus]